MGRASEFVHKISVPLNENEDLDVDLVCEVARTNDSFSFSQGSIDAVHRLPDRFEVYDWRWDEGNYTEEENKIISRYLSDNRETVEQRVFSQLNEELSLL